MKLKQILIVLFTIVILLFLVGYIWTISNPLFKSEEKIKEKLFKDIPIGKKCKM